MGRPTEGTPRPTALRGDLAAPWPRSPRRCAYGWSATTNDSSGPAGVIILWTLFVDEPELCRRDARRRGLDDEAPRDRVIVQVRPRAFDFFSSRRHARKRLILKPRLPSCDGSGRTARRSAAMRGTTEP